MKSEWLILKFRSQDYDKVVNSTSFFFFLILRKSAVNKTSFFSPITTPPSLSTAPRGKLLCEGAVSGFLFSD